MLAFNLHISFIFKSTTVSSLCCFRKAQSTHMTYTELNDQNIIGRTICMMAVYVHDMVLMMVPWTKGGTP